VVGGPVCGDRVDFVAGDLDQVNDVALTGAADLGDAGTDLDQAAQDRDVGDGFGGVGGVRHRGKLLRQGVQVHASAGGGGLSAGEEFLVDGDRVEGLPTVSQGGHRSQDDLVGGTVEHLRAGEFENLGEEFVSDPRGSGGQEPAEG